MSVDYKVKYNEYDEQVCCDSCDVPAPVDSFEIPHHKKSKYEKDKRELCRICAESYVGNATMYPNQYDQSTLVTIAQVGHVILDEMKKHIDKKFEENES